MAQHALLSASSSHRWLHCTPSSRVEEGFPSTSSKFAEEGTLAHELAEVRGRHEFKGLPLADYTAKFQEIKNNELYADEMLEHIESFIDFIQEKYNEAKSRDKEAFICFEEKLDYSEFVPEGFGTGDVVIIADGVLTIIDLKYGKGVMVDAVENTQMMLYGLGAYLGYSIAYEIDTVEMTIYQPRLDNISTYSMSAKDLMNWAENELSEKAALAWDGAGDFVPGEHCRFCKAKATCRALAEENLKLQKYDYKKAEMLTLDEVSDIVKISERLVNWANDVKAYALQQAINGKEVKGWKVVEGRSNRKYIDIDKISEVLIKDGFTEEDIFSKSLLPIGKMEKLLTKKVFNKLLGDLVQKPPGKPTLVPVSDKRKPYVSAEIDFKDVNV